MLYVIDDVRKGYAQSDKNAGYNPEFTPRSEKYMLLKDKGLIEEDEGYEEFDDDDDDDD